MSKASIEAAGLRKRLGPALALDGMAFTVQPGQVTGFVGPHLLRLAHSPGVGARLGSVRAPRDAAGGPVTGRPRDDHSHHHAGLLLRLRDA